MPWTFSTPAQWTAFASSPLTAISPAWWPVLENPACRSSVWEKTKRQNLSSPPATNLNIWTSFTPTNRKKEKKAAQEKASKAAASREKNRPQSDLDIVKQTIASIVEKFSDEDGWIFSGKLGDQLSKRLPDFDVRNFGYAKLTPFVQSLGEYEIKHESNGNNQKQIYFPGKRKRFQIAIFPTQSA